MRLFVSALLLAAASAAFAQDQVSTPSTALQAPANIVAGGGQNSSLTIEALKTKALSITMPQMQFKVEVPGPGQTCYTMRSYRFMREDPKSDATRLKSYSTCEAATDFRMRDAVGSAKPK
jgi:hypothetical protein